MAIEPPKKYHEPVQGTVYHGDGREQALLKHLQSLTSLKSSSTSPDSNSYEDPLARSQRVLQEIDDFGKRDNSYLMNVGETKGRQVEALIKEKKPKLILELGSYVGFSAISFSRHLPTLHPNSKYPSEWTDDHTEDRAGYISLEKSEVYATTARGALELAGLDKYVKIVVGGSTKSLRSLRQTLNLARPVQFDMVFLDHLKPLYTIDLKVMEEEGLVGPGTILVADNVIKPGNPAYLSYVRATPAQKSAAYDIPRLTTQPPPTPNPVDFNDWVTSFRDGPIPETRWAPPEAEGESARGDPRLVYQSEMLHGWDPYTSEKDACEVSTCVKADDA